MTNKLLLALLFFFITPNVWAAGCDGNTQILLHCDGADTSTTFTDENCDGSGAHTVTANGNAQIDTAEQKFGSASGIFDGSGDDLSVPDSPDWDIIANNTDDWTVDHWIKYNNHNNTDIVVHHYEDSSNQWFTRHANGNGWDFGATSGGPFIIATTKGGEITDSNWHHIALVIVGTGSTKDIGMYNDGTQINYVQDNSTDTFSGSLFIGDNGAGGNGVDGWMDEIRIQKSNYFSTTPVVGLTGSFIPPTEAYSVASTRRRIIKFAPGFKYQIRKEFVKKETSGYDRHITNYWFTHKDV